jgi:hypothetical protein
MGIAEQNLPLRTEFHASLGDMRVKILKMHATPRGDLYVICPIGDAGLHLAMHPSGEIHVKDKFGFNEVVEHLDLQTLDSDEILEEIVEKVAGIGYSPTRSNDVFLFQLPERLAPFEDLSSSEFFPRHVDFDVLRMAEGFLGCGMYVTPADNVPDVIESHGLGRSLVIDPGTHTLSYFEKGCTDFGISLEIDEMGLPKWLRQTKLGKAFVEPAICMMDRARELQSLGLVDPRSMISGQLDRGFMDDYVKRLSRGLFVKRIKSPL